MNDDYYGDEYLQDRCEVALLALGGQQLLDDAHAEAAAWVDRHHPWDGRGEEPPDRTEAYLAMLQRRVELARTGLPPRRPGDDDQSWGSL